MEDSSEVLCEENKATSDKKPGRRFKSKAQLQALEDFYNEHKYPTESLKAEIAFKLDLTEKQVSGWFCHRRLKDKRILNEELQAPGRHDRSSGVIQDRGSGLKQDSCSSTKQADYRVADVREVESRRFCRDNLPAAELNYHKRVLGNGTEMDDTSSESSSALQESFHPQKRSPLDMEVTEYRTPNGFIPPSRGRVGPSGYLKIKGQTENVAITAVKRQLGRHYREDGPSLGIEFDPLPPGAFESQCNDTDDVYGVPDPIGPSSVDVSGIHKRPVLSTIRKHDMYVEAADYRPLHKSESDDFSYRQPKHKQPFINHSRGFSDQKSPFRVDSFSTREASKYDSSINHMIQRNSDLPGMRSDSYLEHPPHPYGGKVARRPEEPWSPEYDNLNSKIVRRRERLDSGPAALAARHKDHINNEDRMIPRRVEKDEDLYVERRPLSEHHDSIRLKMRPTNELKAGKRIREDILQEDYPIRTFREPPQWSRQVKGSTEMPSSFSEDETGETSSSMD